HQVRDLDLWPLRVCQGSCVDRSAPGLKVETPSTVSEQPINGRGAGKIPLLPQPRDVPLEVSGPVPNLVEEGPDVWPPRTSSKLLNRRDQLLLCAFVRGIEVRFLIH